jgi:hypothetical protein
MVYSRAWEKLIHEKNPKQKISWHCPFNLRKLEFAAWGGLGEGREQILGSCQPEKRLDHSDYTTFNNEL